MLRQICPEIFFLIIQYHCKIIHVENYALNSKHIYYMYINFHIDLIY